MTTATTRPKLREIPRRGDTTRRRPPERKARMPAFFGIPADVEPDEIFDRLNLLIVGSGSIGGPCIDALARQNPAAITVCDPKPFKPESLLTTLATAPGDVGKLKATRSAARGLQVSRSTHFRAFTGTFEQLPLECVTGVDLIICCTDNVAAELSVAGTAGLFGIPVVFCNVQGPSGLYQLRYFANEDPEAGCPACNMSREELRLGSRPEVRFSCEGSEDTSDGRAGQEVTASIPALCALAGMMAALLANKVVLRLGQPLPESCIVEGTFIRPDYAAVVPLPRNPDCTYGHRRWVPRQLDASLKGSSIRGLIEAAGMTGAGSHLTVQVGDGFSFVTRGFCPNCGEKSIDRFVRSGRDVRCRCKSTFGVSPFHRYARVPLESLNHVINRSLASLGAGSASWAAIENGQRGVWLSDAHAKARNP